MLTEASHSLVNSFKPSLVAGLPEKLKAKQLKIIAIRHGEATHNINSLMNSSRSPGIHLTERGLLQVKRAGERLSATKIDHVYVSPVYRTMQTAHHLSLAMEIPSFKLTVTEFLREQHFGIYEERSYYEYVNHFDDPEDVYSLGAPHGETGKELYERTRDFLLNIADTHSNETILFVTHAFNCHHINYCLTGNDADLPNQAEYKIYTF